MRQNISLNELIHELDYTQRQCENLQPLLNEVGNIVKNEAELSFEREQDAFGNAWKPLSAKTLKHKRGNKILTESSLLQSSINSRSKLQHSINNNGNIKGSVSIGTNIEYAPIHQFGGKAGRGLKVNIPARPFLPIKDNKIPDALKEDIKEVILSHLRLGR